MPPETDLRVDWLATVERVVGLAVTLYVVYLLVPGLHEAIDSLAREVRSEWHTRRRRQREINQMIFETMVVQSIIERGGADGLSADLGITD